VPPWWLLAPSLKCSNQGSARVQLQAVVRLWTSLYKLRFVSPLLLPVPGGGAKFEFHSPLLFAHITALAQSLAGIAPSARRREVGARWQPTCVLNVRMPRGATAGRTHTHTHAHNTHAPNTMRTCRSGTCPPPTPRSFSYSRDPNFYQLSVTRDFLDSFDTWRSQNTLRCLCAAIGFILVRAQLV
jgi:hypothetical protein